MNHKHVNTKTCATDDQCIACRILFGKLESEQTIEIHVGGIRVSEWDPEVVGPLKHSSKPSE
jgi:hypothetical protein